LTVVVDEDEVAVPAHQFDREMDVGRVRLAFLVYLDLIRKVVRVSHGRVEV
jgi:hypothetical protein